MSGGILTRAGDRSHRADLSTQARAIRAHLALLLNTRHGSSALDPDYGLPDLEALSRDLPAAMPSLQRTLSAAILRHEPRIATLALRPLPPGARTLGLCFACRAGLRRGGSLHFELVVAHGGRVTVGEAQLGTPSEAAAGGAHVRG